MPVLFRNMRGVMLAALVATGLSACVDDSISSEDPSLRPQMTVATLPDSEVYEDAPLLAVARALPTFGGYYFNAEGQLVIALTNADDYARAQPLVEAQLEGRKLDRGMTFEVVQHSFMDLARYRTVINRSLPPVTGITAIGVKESRNRVLIGISNESVERLVRPLLEALQIPQEAVMFALMGAPVEDNLDTSWPLKVQGGWYLKNEAGSGGCTVGFNALRASDSLPVFVTNSHCTITMYGSDPGPPSDFFYVNRGGRVGYETSDPGYWNCTFLGMPGYKCRNSDAALIAATDTIDWGKIARTTYSSGAETIPGSKVIDTTNATIAFTGRHSHNIDTKHCIRWDTRAGGRTVLWKTRVWTSSAVFRLT